MSSSRDSLRPDQSTPSTSGGPRQYGPPQYQQPYGPPGFYPPPVKKKSRTPLVLGVIAVVFVLFVGGCMALVAAVGSGLDEASTSGSSANPVSAAPAAGMGAPVRDGKFEFTVTKIEIGPARIGTETFGQTAQGQFILLYLTVANIGDVAQTFSDSSQKLFDAQGREFSADSSAAIYLDDSQSFLNEINPGNQVNGIVVFDVPKDAQPVRVELHDSPFSGGVTVTLG